MPIWVHVSWVPSYLGPWSLDPGPCIGPLNIEFPTAKHSKVDILNKTQIVISANYLVTIQLYDYPYHANSVDQCLQIYGGELTKFTHSENSDTSLNIVN